MKIYLTYRNADMTEGRGPMVPDLAFTELDLANEYIDEQLGVMGRKVKWSLDKYGDWIVKELEVLNQSVKSTREKKETLKASGLSKLTPGEKEALGLD
jgi:hypothetical protein